ncbi:MAG: ClbS/DfsB family four-helix bundle protein [Pseudobacteriovorax sp.]|nr:ClbS/DfsB family four-helix bundle protein [Pseudobacteriovorax sp.]
MSNIPKNRQHLIELLEKHFEKLWALIEGLEEADGRVQVDEDFSVKDIIVIRNWWLASVQKWVKAGQKGKEFPLPAKGYSWKDTPALNAMIAETREDETLAMNRKKLRLSHKRLLKLIGALSDSELTEVGFYEWSRKWPLMRWISVGSSSQYDSAAKLIRKALKAEGII